MLQHVTLSCSVVVGRLAIALKVVCCRVLQVDAVCFSVLQCCSEVTKRLAIAFNGVFCRVLQCVVVLLRSRWPLLLRVCAAVCRSMLQCVAVCGNVVAKWLAIALKCVLQCGAWCCSVVLRSCLL